MVGNSEGHTGTTGNYGNTSIFRCHGNVATLLWYFTTDNWHFKECSTVTAHPKKRHLRLKTRFAENFLSTFFHSLSNKRVLLLRDIYGTLCIVPAEEYELRIFPFLTLSSHLFLLPSWVELYLSELCSYETRNSFYTELDKNVNINFQLIFKWFIIQSVYHSKAMKVKNTDP